MSTLRSHSIHGALSSFDIGGSMRNPGHFLLGILASCVVYGCAPIQPSAPPTPDPTRACFDAALAEPIFGALREKIVLGLERPSLEMQANTGTPTQEDRAAIISYARLRERCFQEGASWRSRNLPPTMHGIADYGISTIDASLSALYRSEISFGRYNVNLEAARQEGRRKVNGTYFAGYAWPYL